ncbi:MerR family transcriptional regulator [Actinoplanes sp. RD1]|uniref:MerR family transcriptional regulator n=1 Tax=Actinoplanes sp. RD1 TaxID=3064538 RepID=UPI0027409E01|nr:MerR family transcriptional regulator [Actinoplanes sp. RD1]
MLAIGDLAARAGVTTRALRYYGQQGLLPAARTGGGQRRYPDAALDRVRLIQDLFAAGLPSRVIGVLLLCVDTKSIDDETVDLLHEKRERMVRQIQELTASLERLDDIIHIATTPGACRD